MSGSYKSVLLVLGAFAMTASGTAAHAQFGKLFNDARRGAQKASSGCGDGKKGDVARGALGGLLGGIGRRTARRSGVTRFVPVAQFEDTLTTEIACILDEDEQKQAAEATIAATRFDPAPIGGDSEDGEEATPEAAEALRGPPVGQTASWTSGTRDDVTGTSTVTAREETGDDSDCIFVTDIVIVRGEETRAEKRMCRTAGSRRYTIVA